MRILLALLLVATPVERARTLAEGNQWDELYLAFSSGDPGQHRAPERKEIARLMRRGAEALEGSDGVMAFSLADRAAAFDESPEGLLLLARIAGEVGQREVAERALRRGLERAAGKGAFALELGKLLLAEGDARGAAEVLGKVPASAPESRSARALLEKARQEVEASSAAQRQLRTMERQIGLGGPLSEPEAETPPSEPPSKPGRPAKAPSGPSVAVGGRTYESRVGADGMRQRGNDRFVIRYFNGDRDFGQRAEYEGKVVAALDVAWEQSQRVLGAVRQSAVDVILYTKEEFRTHFGASYAEAAAGFYREGAIRLNDGAEMTEQARATLVHEYVHAVVDDLVGRGGRRVPNWLNEGLAEYVEYRYLGEDEPPLDVRKELQQVAGRGMLPSLASYEGRTFIEQSNPGHAYAQSAVAARELLKRGGATKLLGLVRAVGAGADFAGELARRYDGMTVAKLDDHVARVLKR